MPLGIMLEVPSAALCIDRLLDEVDFVSIGSNDLIQYLMAADRDNPKVAHLCEPFGPPIFKLLAPGDQDLQRARQTGDACAARWRAGRAACCRCSAWDSAHFSMSPGFVPTIKELLRHTTLPVAQEAAAPRPRNEDLRRHSRLPVS